MTRNGGFIRGVLLLLAYALCLFQVVLHHQSAFFRRLEDDLLSAQDFLPYCLLACFGALLLLSFRKTDILLIAFLLLVSVAQFAAVPPWGSEVVVLIAAVTLGKGVMILRRSEAGAFFVALALMLAFASWWHLKIPANFYTGPRWMGLWNNPNDYGLLMGVGVLLALGLLAEWKRQDGGMRIPLAAILLTAAVMMLAGLVASFSRGAWLGTAFGLVYLAGPHVKVKWWHVTAAVVVAAAVAWCCWGAADSAPWLVKRLDLSRGSVTHRLSAWRAGLQMMLDHPLGVGQDNVLRTYRENYSPPSAPDAERAIVTNDYLMIGTQWGWPTLACFVSYLILCYRPCRQRVLIPHAEGMKFAKYAEGSPSSTTTTDTRKGKTFHTDPLGSTCRAGALVLLVGFWFDAGLFKLPIASTFWVLLGLGATTQPRDLQHDRMEKIGTKGAVKARPQGEEQVTCGKEVWSKAARWRRWIWIGLWVALLIPALQVAWLWFCDSPGRPMVARGKAGKSPFNTPIEHRWVELQEVSNNFCCAVWQWEDRRFFQHWGFDWDEIGNALRDAQASGRPVRGASTITQQCARSLFLWQGRSWIRKGLEAYYTVWMETLLSKRRIFEIYVNVVEFGDGIYGIEAAARHYYDVSAKDLTREQAAMLVAVMPQPRKLNPIQPTEKTLWRQKLILKRSEGLRFPLSNRGGEGN